MMRSYKKAQIQGQIFIYILTLIIAGVIFIFGYNAVSSFSSQIEASKIINFENDMNSVFDKLSSEYQSYEEHTFSLPGSYEKVCFANLDHTDFKDQAFMESLMDSDPMVYDIINSDIKDNVFIYSNWFEKSFDVGKIKIKTTTSTDDPFECYNLFNGKLSLYIRGLGDKAEIEEVSAVN